MTSSAQPVYLPTTHACSAKPLSVAEPEPVIHDSSLSIYERLRHFLYINFVLNKRSFILSILSYMADLLLYVGLNLYLFVNKPYTYEHTCALSNSGNETIRSVIKRATNESQLTINSTSIGTTTMTMVTTSMLNYSNGSLIGGLEQVVQLENASLRTKQSYLTLQILAILVFFICFILSYLIKLQFKYHRLALNLYGN